MTTDEILTQVLAGRDAGTFDPVRQQIRTDRLPESIYGPRVRLLEALAGVARLLVCRTRGLTEIEHLPFPGQPSVPCVRSARRSGLRSGSAARAR